MQGAAVEFGTNLHSESENAMRDRTHDVSNKTGNATSESSGEVLGGLQVFNSKSGLQCVPVRLHSEKPTDLITPAPVKLRKEICNRQAHQFRDAPIFQTRVDSI